MCQKDIKNTCSQYIYQEFQFQTLISRLLLMWWCADVFSVYLPTPTTTLTVFGVEHSPATDFPQNLKTKIQNTIPKS